MTIRFSMSANKPDVVKLREQPARAGCTIIYWEDLEDLKNALGTGVTVEARYDPAGDCNLNGFLRFLVANKYMIKRQVKEEKSIRIEVSRDEMKSLADLNRPLMFGLCAPSLRFLAELGLDLAFYSHHVDE